MANAERYWEIDLIRAVGLILMIVQHTVIVWMALTTGTTDAPALINLIGHAGGFIFVLLVGLSAYLSYSFKEKNFSDNELINSFLWRGLQILGWGLVINIASVLVLPKGPVYFGVLHFIGTAVIVAPFFIRYRWIGLATAVLSPILATIFSFFPVSTLSYIVVGLYPADFSSIDYWPVFPWITVPLIGIEIGRRLYPGGKRTFPVRPQPESLKFFVWLGTHTLVIYLLHIPLLLLLLSTLYNLVD